MTRSKTQELRKSPKSRKFFCKLFKSEFSILAVGQNQQLKNKKTGNNISKISEISQVPEFLICHFFIFFLNLFFLFLYVFSVSLFYICNYSSNFTLLM